MSKVINLPTVRATRFWRGMVGSYAYQIDGADQILTEDDVLALFADLVSSWGAPAMLGRLDELRSGETGGSVSGGSSERGQISEPFAIAAGPDSPKKNKTGGSPDEPCTWCGSKRSVVNTLGELPCPRCRRDAYDLAFREAADRRRRSESALCGACGNSPTGRCAAHADPVNKTGG